jgi:hypothetical protein
MSAMRISLRFRQQPDDQSQQQNPPNPPRSRDHGKSPSLMRCPNDQKVRQHDERVLHLTPEHPKGIADSDSMIEKIPRKVGTFHWLACFNEGKPSPIAK